VKFFHKFILINNRIPPNLKSTIYSVTLREGGFQEWNFAFKQYEDTTSASEKEIILSALGNTQKPWLLTKYLNMIIMPNSTIRKQDGARVFASVSAEL
jgi:aminopeptidase N